MIDTKFKTFIIFLERLINDDNSKSDIKKEIEILLKYAVKNGYLEKNKLTEKSYLLIQEWYNNIK